MPRGDPFTALCQRAAGPVRRENRADLHLHTTFSDGLYTPAEVVDLAQRSGLSALAITDHDTTAGLAPARAAAGASLEIITGVEITAEYQQRELHLLGYFFDEDHPALQAALDWLRIERVARFQAMIEKLRSVGVILESPTSEVGGALGRRHLAYLLVKARKVATVQQAFRSYLGDHGRIQVPKRRLPVAEAIRLVREAGGIAAWAHPTYHCTREALTELRQWGMGAIEVDFPSCRPGRKRELRHWAGELGLEATGGSDCHGPDHAGRTVGICGISAGELDRLRANVARRSAS